MTDAWSRRVPRRPGRSPRWTSFVGGLAKGKRVRALHDERNPLHRVRVEHNRDTLLIHVSNENGQGWTTIAIDRPTREWSIAQRAVQLEAAKAAYGNLYTAK
jgi:hypothetical protein